MNSVNKNVAAVVVTYNRCELLLECINAICKQTTKPDLVIVVDNASTDGTESKLVQQFDFSDKNIEYVRLEKNTGGAGGFSYGMRHAFEKGYKWLWLMDDDVEPLPNALEKLLGFSDRSRCIHPGRIFKDGELVSWNYIFDPLSMQDVNIPKSAYFDDEISFVNTGCFEGMLIASDIVKLVGFPDKNFFITKDDLLYGFEASFHTNVCVTREPLLIKKIKPSKIISKLALLHSIKNILLTADKLDVLFPKQTNKRAIYKYLLLINYFVTTIRLYRFAGLVLYAKSILLYRSIKKEDV